MGAERADSSLRKLCCEQGLEKCLGQGVCRCTCYAGMCTQTRRHWRFQREMHRGAALGKCEGRGLENGGGLAFGSKDPFPS